MVRVIRMIIFTKKLITMTRLMMSVAISFMVMITMMTKKAIITMAAWQFLVAKKLVASKNAVERNLTR